jgi:hypothetical protein
VFGHVEIGDVFGHVEIGNMTVQHRFHRVETDGFQGLLQQHRHPSAKALMVMDRRPDGIRLSW